MTNAIKISILNLINTLRLNGIRINITNILLIFNIIIKYTKQNAAISERIFEEIASQDNKILLNKGLLLKLFSLGKFFYEKNLSNNLEIKTKYEIVKELIKYNENSSGVDFPNSLISLFIDDTKLFSSKKILIPDVKQDCLLLEVIYRLVKNDGKNINEILSILVGYSISNEIKDFIEQATLFIFGEKYCIHNEDFLGATINDKFDYVICNPKFGKTSKQSYYFQEYELIAPNAYNKFMQQELLFLEKIYKISNFNSYITILLPNGILENEINKNTREWILKHFKIEEIISIYSGVFKPVTNIKTSILKLEKTSQEASKYNFIVSIVSSEKELVENSYFKSNINFRDLSTNNFTPEYYKRQNSLYLKEIENCNYLYLKDIVKIQKSKAKILGDNNAKINYVDISSVDFRTGKIKNAKAIKVIDAPKRAYYQVSTNDLLFAVSGGSLGTKSQVIAVINSENDKNICSNGFRVLTLYKDINPYYLWYFMRSSFFLEQVKQVATGSTILNLKENDLMSLKIYLPEKKIQDKIAKDVLENIKQLTESERFLVNSEDYILKKEVK